MCYRQCKTICLHQCFHYFTEKCIDFTRITFLKFGRYMPLLRFRKSDGLTPVFSLNKLLKC